MPISKPRILIVQENEDANLVLTGILWLKGCEPYKFTNGEKCLEKLNEMEGKVDVVIIGGSIACDRNFMLIVNIIIIKLN